MESKMFKIYARSDDRIQLKIYPGHFATPQSHITHFLDITTMKSRSSEARRIAQALAANYEASIPVDTIVCMDGLEVVGAYLAEELTKAGVLSMNAHQTIYVVTPEHTSGSQLLFRENTAPMITNKHVLILAASVTTGFTAQAAVEAVDYYGGIVAGITAIFATVDECAGHPVTSIFDPATLGDYQSFDSRDCPWCKAGQKIDAQVNSYGYSSL